MSLEWTVGPAERRVPLRKLLARWLPEVSRMRLRRLVAAGQVCVNGLPVDATYRGVVGEQVSLALTEPLLSALLPEPIPITILLEDDHILAVDKPAGMLVHPTAAEKSGTLLNAASYYLKSTGQASVRPGLVHRLDRQTSGIVVLAKTPRAHRHLSRQFSRRLVKKTYLGLALGRVPDLCGVIEAPLGYLPESFPHWQVTPAGRAAVTEYRVLGRRHGPEAGGSGREDDFTDFTDFTLLELNPLTGRTNQLRVHCAALGYPLVNDYVYGAAANEARFGAWPAQPTTSRHLLHAAALGLRHPGSNEWLELRSPLPADISQYLAALTEEALEDDVKEITPG